MWAPPAPRQAVFGNPLAPMSRPSPGASYQSMFGLAPSSYRPAQPQAGGGYQPQQRPNASAMLQHWFYFGVAIYTILLVVAGIFVARQAFDPFEQAKFEITHWQSQMFEWKQKVDVWKGAYNEHADLLPEPQMCPVCSSCEAPDLCTGNDCPDELLPKCKDSATAKTRIKLGGKAKGLKLMDMLRFKMGAGLELDAECPVCDDCGLAHGGVPGGEGCDKSALFYDLEMKMEQVIAKPADHVLALQYATWQQCLKIAMPIAYEHYAENLLGQEGCLSIQCMIDRNMIPLMINVKKYKEQNNATDEDVKSMIAVGFDP